jgi:hypothetical protein
MVGTDDWWGNNGGRQWRGGRGPQHSINFITAHDGFTLADLVAYNEKHNECNGESNRCETPAGDAGSSCFSGVIDSDLSGQNSNVAGMTSPPHIEQLHVS